MFLHELSLFVNVSLINIGTYRALPIALLLCSPKETISSIININDELKVTDYDVASSQPLILGFQKVMHAHQRQTTSTSIQLDLLDTALAQVNAYSNDIKSWVYSISTCPTEHNQANNPWHIWKIGQTMVSFWGMQHFIQASAAVRKIFHLTAK